MLAGRRALDAEQPDQLLAVLLLALAAECARGAFEIGRQVGDAGLDHRIDDALRRAGREIRALRNSRPRHRSSRSTRRRSRHDRRRREDRLARGPNRESRRRHAMRAPVRRRWRRPERLRASRRQWRSGESRRPSGRAGWPPRNRTKNRGVEHRAELSKGQARPLQSASPFRCTSASGDAPATRLLGGRRRRWRRRRRRRRTVQRHPVDDRSAPATQVLPYCGCG